MQLPHKETTWYGKKAKQYCLAQVLVAKAKKYASNAAFTIHNAKLKPYNPGSRTFWMGHYW